MTNVLKELSQWATTLQPWEQAALDKIAAGAKFADSDYDELFQYLLEDANLVEPMESRPTLCFPKDVDPDSQPTAPTQLINISSLQNINALVPDQTLTFGPALTAIYGGNGSGKSGYARVLGCAGFTRGDQEVLPDVTRPADEANVLSANIEVTDGTAKRVIHYQVGRQCPELASFYVFDSTSVRVHLNESNSLSFSPSGLSYLTRLAEVTDEVRKHLKDRIEAESQPHNFSALFQGETEVSELIANLGPDTDLNILRQMSTLSPEQEAQIDKLDLEIARLKVQNISDQMDDITQRISSLENVINQLRAAQEKLDDKAMEGIRAAVKSYLERQKVAQRISVDQFQSEHFTQTGSDIWYQFISAAKSLADVEQSEDRPYPQTDSHCLLCQQSLSGEARDLLLRLWTFLEEEAQEKLQEAQATLDQQRTTLDQINLNFFDSQSVSYRHLQEHNPPLLAKVRTFVAGCRKRREAAHRITITCTFDTELPSLSDDGISDIKKVIIVLKVGREQLKKQDPTEEIKKLGRQMRNLQHRLLLCQHLSGIEKYVQKRLWVQRAAKVGGSTRHITAKHNQLFGQLVTDRYIELFEQMLEDLGRSLKVKVTTRGRKGEVYKQIVVEGDPSTPRDITVPDKVLSEGEKRAVALADFLTEVTLDTTSSGIILDDPVTSLDLEWRGLIASILAKEAKRRQVIVFTHDLPFLYLLKKQGQQEDVEIKNHWIKRGDNDDKPGYVFLNNSPALEREYRKATRARDIYAKAQGAAAAEQEILLRDGFGALRTSYEAFIIFELFSEVVMRFDERISFGRLKDIVWDRSIADEVIAKCELLSKYIEGHLHSDAMGAIKPTPDMLMDEIEAFEALKKRLKTLKKQ